MKTDKKYNLFSKVYDLLEIPNEKFFMGKYRKQAIKNLTGEVLEVGIGTGNNIKYYPDELDVIGIDFSSGMLKKAYKKRDKHEKNNVKLKQMDVEKLEFEYNRFDSAITTFVFCTVPNPRKGLEEVYRVLKPGGKFILIEHMKSKKWYLNIFLYTMNFFTKRLVGTSMIRETTKNLKKFGFVIEDEREIFFDIVKFLVVKKPKK